MVRTLFLALTSACLLLMGCGDGANNPQTVPVSGTVYLNGQPLVGAEIVFSSNEKEFVSYGKTGPDGKYELAQGAVPGENKVSISKWEGEEVEFNPEEGWDEGQMEASMEGLANPGNPSAAPRVGPRQLVPPEFNTKSKLTYPVPEGGTDSADFRLTGG